MKRNKKAIEVTLGSFRQSTMGVVGIAVFR